MAVKSVHKENLHHQQYGAGLLITKKKTIRLRLKPMKIKKLLLDYTVLN